MKYLILLSVFALFSCARSPTGRSQLLLVPDGKMNAMGTQAFGEMKQSIPTENDAATNAYIRCITVPITEAARGQLNVQNWETVVFKDNSANAFALPGGKIGVHTGLLVVAKTPSQLAAVIGHEVGHVIARHGAERVSTQMATQGGLVAIDAFLLGKGKQDPLKKTALMAALGLGVQVGVALPHSRTQESEADLIGQRLMAQAGFDPRESVDLWHNMMAASGGKAPKEWLSTHPAGDTRIQNLQAHMPEALKLFEQAKAAGKNPDCRLH